MSLPEDFFLSTQPPGLELAASIDRKTTDRIEIEQKFPGKAFGATPINLATFCMAMFLAKRLAFEGAAVAVISPTDAESTSRTVAVALLQSESDYKTLDSSLNWTPYLSLTATRKGCSSWVDARYLW